MALRSRACCMSNVIWDAEAAAVQLGDKGGNGEPDPTDEPADEPPADEEQ